MALWDHSEAGPASANTRCPAEARWFHWLGLTWSCLLSMQAPESCADSRWDVQARSTRRKGDRRVGGVGLGDSDHTDFRRN